MTTEQRGVLVEILMNHWPNPNASCRLNCTKLGESWPEHIADLFDEALSAPTIQEPTAEEKLESLRLALAPCVGQKIGHAGMARILSNVWAVVR